MSKADILVEIGTEELPPKALSTLSQAFADGISSGLKNADIVHGEVRQLASPRRLAVIVRDAEDAQPDREIEKRGPALKAAFGEDGCPSKAAIGFASSCGVTVEQLDTIITDKGEWLVFRNHQQGRPTTELLADIINQSLAQLPIPKRMRWGDRSEEFVRPVHWVVLLYGNKVVAGDIMGLKPGNLTRGHRFHYPKAIKLKSAADYEELLEQKGFVLVDMAQRCEAIRQQVEQAAEQLGGRALIDEDLLQEVSALVEWPVAVAGDFDEHFLKVPKESLISSMQDHQKYFPILDGEGNLMPHFITISNIDSKDISKVKEGNERVIRPRLSDAAFFWNQDCKHLLETHLNALDKVVFQNKLGSLGDKSRRVAKIAKQIAIELGVNADHAHRAALLSKCDLMSEMVYEFPDLQGIMGRYYALNDGEPEEVAIALDEQYMPRFAGDELPATMTGQILAVADKLDTLLGIFAIGQKPTGEKDPFALRRATLGILRILIEREMPLDLRDMLGFAAEALGDRADASQAIDEVLDFMLERLRVYYLNQDISADVFDSVVALKPTTPVDFDRRVFAVNSFRQLAEADSLAAAHKRIGNILKKIDGTHPDKVDKNLMSEPAETELYEQLLVIEDIVTPLFEEGDYKQALQHLAGLRDAVDSFFDKVMVMADDEALKNNRVALLGQLYALFMKAADLSRLQS
ncbi:MAG: glycine--tRNA ligase subunit beta [Gammaproteobacteria bacterium]